ncbi:MAG: hypothetical protein J6A92_06770 [Lachnospiraceae bacterium]|nr:hypothetical protein [Lachnospiraceae bacterium]
MGLQEKYESDLSRKEKWQLECQKLRKMRGKQKIEYLFTYYKAVLLIFVAVLLIVYTGATMIENGSKHAVLSIVISDVKTEKEPEIRAWGDGLLSVLEAEEENASVAIDTAVTSKEDEASVVKAAIALSGELENNDVVFCGEEIYQKFAAENAFLDITEILGENACENLPVKNGVLLLADCDKWEELGFCGYSNGYLCVLKNARNTENVHKLVDYLWEE